MPALRLSGLSSVAAPKHAIYGLQGDWKYICHVGLLPGATTVNGVAKIRLIDMKPTLQMANGEPVSPSVIAWVHLDDDELEAIDVWLADIETQLANINWLAQYVAVPAFTEEVDASSGRFKHVRASCAGLVLKAYEVAGRMLLADAASFPEVSKAELLLVWPQLSRANSTTLNRIGLTGEGPWRVLLPGYLLHACAAEVIPYSPSSEAMSFP